MDKTALETFWEISFVFSKCGPKARWTLDRADRRRCFSRIPPKMLIEQFSWVAMMAWVFWTADSTNRQVLLRSPICAAWATMVAASFSTSSARC